MENKFIISWTKEKEDKYSHVFIEKFDCTWSLCEGYNKSNYKIIMPILKLEKQKLIDYKKN